MNYQTLVRTLTAATVAVGAPLLLGSSVPAHAAATCQGQAVTIEGSGDLTGTPGDDVILTSGHTVVRGGGGSDLVCVTGGAVWVLGERISVFSQAPAGTGATVTLSATSYASYVGSPDQDELSVYPTIPAAFDFDLTSGGSDTVFVMAQDNTTVASRGAVRFGPGSTELVTAGLRTADVDLASGTFSVDGTVSGTVSGTSNVYAFGEQIRLRGDSSANRLYARGCDVVSKGGKGPDEVARGRYADAHDIDGVRCPDGLDYTFKGGDGNDTLRGTTRDDRILGGPGYDKANGRGGHDRCRAEVVKNCEG